MKHAALHWKGQSQKQQLHQLEQIHFANSWVMTQSMRKRIWKRLLLVCDQILLQKVTRDEHRKSTLLKLTNLLQVLCLICIMSIFFLSVRPVLFVFCYCPKWKNIPAKEILFLYKFHCNHINLCGCYEKRIWSHCTDLILHGWHQKSKQLFSGVAPPFIF